MTPGVVVVAFGAPEVLQVALSPLTGFDVVVVDNSSDARVRAVCEQAGVRYVDPGRNLGFAAGVNLGVERFDAGRDVLLLNPDAVVTAQDVATLHNALRDDPRTAAAAPRLRDAHGDQRARWPWPRPGALWREALLPRRRPDDGGFLVGAVLLLRAEAWRDVGPFDERFFLYAEETDWQRRAVDRGWQLRLMDDVVAHHAGAGTSDDPRRREALFHAGAETYVRKHFGATGWASYRTAAVLGAALRAPLPGRRGAAARGRVSLYLRGPRRAAGLDP